MNASERYGPVIGGLLAEERLAVLGPGTPNAAMRSRLAALADETTLGGAAVRERAMAGCCRAGLWLYHDFMDEAHTTAQDIETASGSYWHAILHRREPDYSNSKYWFRRVGDHAVFVPLCQAAQELAAQESDAAAKFLRTQAAWDPMRFVDLCESARASGTEMLCRQVQQREWELLFDYCYRQAVGS